MAPGTYACARCPANAIAPNAGPTTACTPCARPLVANANATDCAYCPLLMRSNGTACAPCPADLWCEGGKELPCPYAGQCLGNLQGCRAGHAGYLCTACVRRYYKAPSSFCEPCGAELWQAAAWVAAFVAGTGLLAVILPEQRRRAVAVLRGVYSKHDAVIQMMLDHVTRLTNLNRLSLLSLPAGFKQALAIAGVFFGFNTANAATECASAAGGWTFQQKWGLTVGAVLGVVLFFLLLDLRERKNIKTSFKLAPTPAVAAAAPPPPAPSATGTNAPPLEFKSLKVALKQYPVGDLFTLTVVDRAPAPKKVEKWRAWDAMDSIFMQAVQASWEAMAFVNVDGANRLLSEPSTLFDEYPHFYIFCASVAIVVIYMCGPPPRPRVSAYPHAHPPHHAPPCPTLTYTPTPHTPCAQNPVCSS